MDIQFVGSAGRSMARPWRCWPMTRRRCRPRPRPPTRPRAGRSPPPSPPAGSRAAKGQALDFLAPAGIGAARLLVLGVGARDGFDLLGIEHAAAGAYQAVKASGVKTLVLDFDGLDADGAARAASGVRLAAYRFDRYRTKEKPEVKPSVETVRIGDLRPGRRPRRLAPSRPPSPTA